MKNKKKILINAFSARIGGGQTYLKNLIRHLPVQKDLEVVVFTAKNINLPKKPNVRYAHTIWPIKNPILRTFYELFIFPYRLHKEQAAVLFCPGGVISTRAPKDCKIVTMFQNMIPFDKRTRKLVPLGLQRIRNILLKNVMLKSMQKADLTIFISEYARSIIEQFISIKNPVTIPHGIDSIFATNGKLLNKHQLMPEKPYILYVSRFDVYKHHYEVVKAYSMLTEGTREQFPLVLVGETNFPEAKRVKRLVDKINIDKQIKIVGPIPYSEMPAVYRYAHLIIFASSCENCPNILLEAMGACKPILCSNIMPMPEFAGDATAYFSPDKPHEIYNLLNKALTDHDFSKRLANDAAKRGRLFNSRTSAEKTWSSILKLIT